MFNSLIFASSVLMVKCCVLLDYSRLDEDMAERMSAMRRPGESELDYYERRYQERVCSLSS